MPVVEHEVRKNSIIVTQSIYHPCSLVQNNTSLPIVAKYTLDPIVVPGFHGDLLKIEKYFVVVSSSLDKKGMCSVLVKL